jgi:hypothetical protein
LRKLVGPIKFASLLSCGKFNRLKVCACIPLFFKRGKRDYAPVCLDVH